MLKKERRQDNSALNVHKTGVPTTGRSSDSMPNKLKKKLETKSPVY